jgi:hypothetical protein
MLYCFIWPLLFDVFLWLGKLVEPKLVLVWLALLLFLGFDLRLEQLGRLCLEKLFVGSLILGAFAPRFLCGLLLWRR